MGIRRVNPSVYSVAVAICVTTQCLYAQCEPQWTPGFHLPGVNRGLDGNPVSALIEYDDGSGPVLFIGGDFTASGSIAANAIAKWNPTTSEWSALGSGLAGGGQTRAHSFAVFDDGSGPALFVGGDFSSAGGIATNAIAKWDGQSWSAVPGLDLGNGVLAMTVFDDGSGSALYVGGGFNDAGGIIVNNIAKWDGSNWSSLGLGVSGGTVRALEVFDDGTGPALYAAGFFDSAGGLPANRIAKWNGLMWSPLGSGIEDPPGTNPYALALEVYDDGSGLGPALYVGGNFGIAGGLPATSFARWDGTVWSQVGEDLSGNIGAQIVNALHVYDEGMGERLIVGGYFTHAGKVVVNNIASWNGIAWEALGEGTIGSVHSMTSITATKGKQSQLVTGGSFSYAGELAATKVALWDGTSWSVLSDGNGMNNNVVALCTCEESPDGGPAMYAGGNFSTAGGAIASRIARWDGSQWHPLGSGMDDTIFALTCYDEGFGPMLFAGGEFTVAGGIPIQGLARWDGFSWSEVGGGIDGTVGNFAIYNDGAGAGLFVSGDFTTAGGVPASRIAKWDGTNWSPLSLGIDGPAAALTVFTDGINGPALYAGGNFLTVGGMSINYIAKWDGTNWSSVGSGVNGGVGSLVVFDDDGGGPNPPSLFASGGFTEAGGVPANRIAKWDGKAWYGIPTGADINVTQLAVFDDGTGNGKALYAGRFQSDPGGLIIKWDGSTWSDLANGLSGARSLYVYAFTTFDDDRAGPLLPALYVGGKFDFADGIPSNNIGRWALPVPSCYGDIAPGCGDSVVNVNDLLYLISQWGQNGGASDLNSDSQTNVDDLLELISSWGHCQ